MGLLIGCASIPVAIALFGVAIVLLVQEPAAVFLLVGCVWLAVVLVRAVRS